MTTLAWDLLSPWGGEDEPTLVGGLVGGHTWVTDRWVLLRTDLLPADRPEGLVRDDPESIARVLDVRPADHAGRVLAMHLHAARQAGLTLAPVVDHRGQAQWALLRDGEMVGLLTTRAPSGAHTGRHVGADVTREATIAASIRWLLPDALTAWQVAGEAVDAIDRLPGHRHRGAGGPS